MLLCGKFTRQETWKIKQNILLGRKQPPSETTNCGGDFRHPALQGAAFTLAHFRLLKGLPDNSRGYT